MEPRLVLLALLVAAVLVACDDGAVSYSWDGAWTGIPDSSSSDGQLAPGIHEASVSPIVPASAVRTVGSETTFSAVSMGLDVPLAWSASAGTINASTGFWTAPWEPMEVRISAQASSFPALSSTTTVRVVDAPRIATFTASPTSILYGATSTLSLSATGGTASVEPAIGSVSSSANIVVSPLADTPYRLVVTNAAGDSTSATTLVRVSDVTLSPIEPSASSVTALSAVQFRANVAGAVDGGILWSATGGSMNPLNGLWTAPAFEGPVTITATSRAAPQTFAQTSVTVLAEPWIESFQATPPVLHAGASSNLVANFRGGRGFIDHGVGAVTSGVGIVASPVVSTRYTLVVTNGAGASVSSTTDVEVRAVSVSPIVPSDLVTTVRAATTFSATASGAMDPDVVWSATAGQMNAITGQWVAPPNAGLVTIRASALAFPTAYAETTVRVVDAPNITRFAALPAQIAFGQASSLMPLFSGGSGRIEPDIGIVRSGGVVSVSPRADTGYTLTVTNEAGDWAQARTLVRVSPVEVVAINPTDVLRTVGTETQFSAVVAGAVDTTVEWFASEGVMNPSSGVWMAPLTPASVLITARSRTDPTKYLSTHVSVVDAPTIASFVASPPQIPKGGTSGLWAVFAGGIGAIDQGVGAIAGGEARYVSPQSTTTYRLTVESPTGEQVTQSATVTVAAVGITDIAPAHATRTAGTATQFSTSVSGALDSSVLWSSSAGTMNSSTGQWVAPLAAGLVTIMAESRADPTQSTSTTVTVVSPPNISAFSASPSSILFGGQTTLAAIFSGGIGLIYPTVGSITSGAGVVVSPAYGTTYELQVTNAAGTTATSTVDVSVSGVVLSPITPAAATRTVGTATAFSANVTGAADASIEWNATGGIIDALSGAWTAPSTPGEVMITASSRADPGKVMTTTVDVVAAPSISSFVASPSTVIQGNAATLTAVFAGGGGLVNHGIGAVTSSQAVQVFPDTSTSYLLTVTNAAGSVASTSTLITVLTPPALSASDSSLSFGSIAFGASSTQSVTLTNSGQASATGCTAGLSGADSNSFSVSLGDCGATLPGGTDCTLTLSASPAAPGSKSASATYGCAGSIGVSVALTATGLTAPSISSSVPSVAFGPLDYGTSSTQSISFTNQGQTAASDCGASLSGPGAAMFSTTPGAASLGAGATTSVSVTALPATVGTFTATLSMSCGGGSAAAVPLSVSGVTRVVSVTPSHGSTQVNVTRDIAIQFSHPMNPLSFDRTSVTLTDIDTGQNFDHSLSYSSSNRTLTIDPVLHSLFTGHNYRITLSTDVADANGHSLSDGAFVSDFTTSAYEVSGPSFATTEQNPVIIGRCSSNISSISFDVSNGGSVQTATDTDCTNDGIWQVTLLLPTSSTPATDYLVTVSDSGGTASSTLKISRCSSLTAISPSTVFDGGDGTTSTPYLISTAEQLQGINADSSYLTYSYKLTADIDLKCRGWTPIGSASGPLFSGNFDGNHHRIRNLTQEGAGTADTLPTTGHIGLFGAIDPGAGSGVTIKNVGVVDAYIGKTTLSARRGSPLIGAFSVQGYATCTNPLTISGVFTTGQVRLPAQTGGLLGYNGCRVAISDSYSSATAVSTGQKTGGLIGSSTANVSIMNSFTRSAVMGSDLYVGGLIAEAVCSNGQVFEISQSSSTSHVKQGGAKNHTGGLLGAMVGGGVPAGISIDQSYFHGMVWATTGAANVGGLVGLLNGGAGTSFAGFISRSYSAGSVVAPTNVGGLIGYALVESASDANYVVESYSSMTVSGTTRFHPLIGAFGSGPFDETSAATHHVKVSNTYYVKGGCTEICSADNFGGTGMSPAALQVPANFTGFDFANVWYNSGGQNYPYLRNNRQY